MTTLTPRELVASNLKALRLSRKTEKRDGSLRPMNQEEAGKLVAPYLGVEWGDPKIAFSTFERGGDRGRAFSVEDLLALSAAFGVTPLYFLTPPTSEDGEPVEIQLTQERASKRLTTGEVLDLLFSMGGWGEIDERLESLPPEHRGDALRVQSELVDEYARTALGDLEDIERWLVEIAERAGDLHLRFNDARAHVRKRLSDERRAMLKKQAKREEKK